MNPNFVRHTRIAPATLSWAVCLGALCFVAPPRVTAQVAGGTLGLQVAPAEGVAAADKAATAKKDAKVGDADAANKVNDGEVLGFRQSEVAAQMTELEERMFRLAESIRALEPENSSRLLLGLKFAREELILHQMKETQALLDKLNLGEAVVEQKHLLSKLQRLHDMLLSADLDLQMKLERLRQLRDIIKRLDKAITEEEREQTQSQNLAELDKGLEQLRARKVTLDSLVKQQKGHVDGSRPLAALATFDEQQQASLGKLKEAQAATRNETRQLREGQGAAAEPLLATLSEAEQKMSTAEASLDAQKPADAAPQQQEALAALEQLQKDLAKALDVKEAELATEKFSALQRDQAGNRQSTDSITDAVRNLGDTGARALTSLASASGSMSGAEKDLGLRQPAPASTEQASAVESLQSARKELVGELDKLLEQLRSEVKRRVMEDLTLMLEKQTAIRESTTVLAARVSTGGRQILASIIALSVSEGRLVEVADELISLVEETEFGIALPAALSMVRDSMSTVKDSLAAADASEVVIAREREIENDLQELLQAMRQMPSSRSSMDDSDPNRARERELNRIIAELKMIRMVQIRVNRATVQTDSGRAAEAAAIAAELRRRIDNVTHQQDDVREVTDRLFEERADDILQ